MRAFGTTRIAKLSCAFVVLLALCVPGHATEVTGSYFYRDGTPAKDRQLHLENVASRDMFVVVTGNDGSFTGDVPPGQYELRAERGLVLKPKIVVFGSSVGIGRVIEPAPLDVRRPFQRQGLGEAIVQTQAPATANMKGRPMEALTFGHVLIQNFWGPAKPLPPLPPAGSDSPAASPSPASGR